MSNNKPRLIENLRKTMAIALPVLVISGFTPIVMAESKDAIVSAAKSVSENVVEGAKDEAITELKAACDAKIGNACTKLSEAKGAYSETKSETEVSVAETKVKVDGVEEKVEASASEAESKAAAKSKLVK